jgi:hypothetical protein
MVLSFFTGHLVGLLPLYPIFKNKQRKGWVSRFEAAPKPVPSGPKVSENATLVEGPEKNVATELNVS